MCSKIAARVRPADSECASLTFFLPPTAERSVLRRLESLDAEEAREIDEITERYTDVKPHTMAAAIVFAVTAEDALGWDV